MGVFSLSASTRLQRCLPTPARSAMHRITDWSVVKNLLGFGGRTYLSNQ